MASPRIVWVAVCLLTISTAVVGDAETALYEIPTTITPHTDNEAPIIQEDLPDQYT